MPSYASINNVLPESAGTMVDATKELPSIVALSVLRGLLLLLEQAVNTKQETVNKNEARNTFFMFFMNFSKNSALVIKMSS